MGLLDRLLGGGAASNGNGRHALVPVPRPRGVMPGRRPHVAPISRSTLFDTPGFQGGWSLIRGDMPTLYQGTGKNVRTKGWEQNPVVNACARVIVDLAAAVPIEVGSKDAAGEFVASQDNPAVALLAAPRVAMSDYRLRALMFLHFLLYGNAFWHLERARPGGLPTGIRLIHPEHVHHVWLDPETQEVMSFDWRDRFGQVHESPVADIVHFMDLAGMDWIFGYPRAASALQDIVTDGEATQYVRQIVQNDGTPTLVMMVEGNPGDPELQAARARWHERTVERGTRGRAEFVTGVKDVKALGFNLRDLEFPDLRQVSREDICTAFGVDPRMIGIGSARGKGGSSLNSKEHEEARFKLVQNTVRPMLAGFEGQLNLWFMPEFGNVWCRFSPQALADLTENESETWTRVTEATSKGVLTVPEGRARLKLKPKMDASDTLALGTGITFTTVEDALAKAAAPPPPPVGAVPPGGTPGDGTPPPEPPPADAPRSRVLRRAVVLTPAQRTGLWAMADQRATTHEGAYEAAARLLFATERAGVRRILEGTAPARGRRAIDESAQLDAALREMQDEYSRTGSYYEAWLDRFRGLLRDTVTVGARDLAAELGIDFTLTSPRVLAAIQNRANKLTGQVTETTYGQIQDIIAGGRAAGLGVQPIADLIDEHVFGGDAADRARMIARTESIGAMNEGEWLAAVASGVVVEKEWLTQGDPKVRDTHAAQDGQRRALTEVFANGLLYPGDQAGAADEVINCYLPGTVVGGRFDAAMRSTYAGPALELITRSGKRLAVTPNHPVMTAQGLRPARTLRAGDYLIADGRVVEPPRRSQTDHDQPPALIQNVFSTLAKGFPPLRRHLAPDDLHGDAARVHGEVDIVSAYRLLLLNSETPRSQDGGEIVLVPEAVSQSVHSGNRATQKPLDRIMAASSRSPGRAELPVNACPAAPAPFQQLRVGPSPDLYTALAEATEQAGTRNPALVTELLQRSPALVACDQLVEVRHFEFSGHVYDLESDSGLMIAGGILCSNCRCSLLFHTTPS